LDALELSDRRDIVVIDACYQTRIVEGAAILPPQVGLSDREMQLLKLAAGGLPTDEIAQELHITGHTVEFHFRNIMSKMGARNRTHAVAQAMTLGFFTLSDAERVLPGPRA
jgi:DNA-binding CsgD family transcriptional regulator